MKKIRPHPWELPGYRFFVPGFPPGFEASPVEKKPAYNVENLKKGQAANMSKARQRFNKDQA